MFELYSLVNEVLEVGEPLHVESLVLVEGHALDEGCEVLIDTESSQVLSQRGLDSLVKGREVRASIPSDLSLESVLCSGRADVVRDGHIVECNLSIH